MIENHSQIMSSYVVKFPFKNSYTTPEEINSRFNNIRNYKPNFIVKPYTIHNLPDFQKSELTFQGKQVLLILSDDYDLDDISDYFFENIRIDARRYDEKLTLREWWTENYWKYSPEKAKMNREKIYSKYHEITTFRPSVMASIIELFKVESVLDFSAGWGDRLIGCLAKNIKRYTGIDPNTRIDYEKIKSFFEQKFNISTKVKIIYKPAELPEVGKMVRYKHDIIFTSPPYFDLEIYSTDETQSIFDENKKKKSVDVWLQTFLFTTIRNLLPYVKKYLILIINDHPGNRYLRKMLNELNSWKELDYQGVISYAKSKGSPQPMWIWKIK